MRLTRTAWFGSKLFTHHLCGVGLILTRRCNLDCGYCQVVHDADAVELSPDRWLQVIDRFSAHRHRHFVLTGGEPLLYEGLGEVIRHAARRNLVSLITNGTLVEQHVPQELAALDFLTVSMDGMEPGRVSRKSAWAALEPLGEFARQHRITTQIIVTVTRHNVHEVADIARRASGHGFATLLSVVHSGAGDWSFRRDLPDLTFDAPRDLARLAELSAELRHARREGVRIAESDAFLRDMVRFAAGEFRIDCPAADGVFEVDTDGTIMACHDAPRSGVNALEPWHYADMVRRVRATVPPGCTCCYDCFHDLAWRRRHPLRAAVSLVRQQLGDIGRG